MGETNQKEMVTALNALIPSALDRRLEAEAFHSSRTKREIIAAALDTYLLHCEAAR